MNNIRVTRDAKHTEFYIWVGCNPDDPLPINMSALTADPTVTIVINSLSGPYDDGNYYRDLYYVKNNYSYSQYQRAAQIFRVVNKAGDVIAQNASGQALVAAARDAFVSFAVSFLGLTPDIPTQIIGGQ
jgi:hypothetical protein